MSRKYHIYLDLGVSKQTLKYCADWSKGSDWMTDELLELVNRRGSYYTLDELDELKGLFCTTHDEHCYSGCEDCTPLERRNNQLRLCKAERAWEFIDSERDGTD